MPKRKRLWPYLATAVACVAAIGSIITVGALRINDMSLMVNATDSLPGTVFLIEHGKLPTRGDYVAFNAPDNGIYHVPFIKIVSGIEGDRVERHDDIVLVNGKAVGRVALKTVTGETLTPGPTGAVPPASYFVIGLAERSYDSRYAKIGFVPHRDVIGRASIIF